MCRIDAPFGNHPLDEKKDPTERFLQALDEFNVEGNFRTLLIKHFSDHWQSVFRNVSELEKALSDTKQHDTEVEKCIAILLFLKETITNSILRYFNMYKLPVNDDAVIGFLNDVAQTYYPSSPYGLFTAGMNKVQANYFLFVSWLYGKDFCFSKEFFDDKALSSIKERDRTAILWDYFYSISPKLKGLKYYSDDTGLLEELISVAASDLTFGPLTQGPNEILRGFNFIKAWISYDSQAGRFSYSWTEFCYDWSSPWGNIETLIRDKNSDCEDTSKLLNKWLEDMALEFEMLLCLSADLNHASVESKGKWAREIEHCFTSYTHIHAYNKYRSNTLEHDNLSMLLSDALNQFGSRLSPLQISLWIKYSIDNDFERILNSDNSSTRLSDSTEKWINKEYFALWKDMFAGSLNELSAKSRLRILSISAPYSKCNSEGEYLDCKGWWDDLFSNLIEQDNFPKHLTPNWTVIGIDRFKREDMLPFIDKSIGILRGELSQTENTEEELKTYHQQLETLLTALDKLSPEKGLRHRLQLMRSSTVTFSDESISKVGTPFSRDGFNKWYDSLSQLLEANCSYQTNGNRDITYENYEQIKNDFFVAFSYELAEFCLSRLRLRKGQKAKDGKYDPNQVIEQSSIWRQGYLKALTELGFDLNGKVHKTVNFTKQSDPDAAVRAIASECYKTVRRKTKKNPTIQDLKRGIIAAEWWLLLCQRKELGLEVKHEEALKTRRNLMRNP